ncbi:MAG: tetratricopeptide repeat protein [Bacteroidota bacterium]
MKKLQVTGYRLQVVVAFIILYSICNLQLATAQLNSLSTAPDKKETRNGNKQFDKGLYTDAEASYKKALDKKNNMPEATFNLGDAVYQQKRYDEAAKQFQLSGQTNPDKSVKAKAYHNLGNTHLEQQKWEDAVKAYKEALKNNPKDADTKYNLAYANAKLKQQQQSGGDDNKDNNDKKDDKKDQKQDQQDKQDQNKDQKDENQQAKNEEKKEQQQKQGQQPKLSKEEAEKILQAMQNEEQKTNQKVQQKQMKVMNVKIEKDW